MLFQSPSKGQLDFEGVFRDLIAFVRQMPEFPYKLIIGSDSQVHDEIVFVTAIVVHRLGHGARYYYQRQRHRRMQSLRQRIYYETSLSLSLAARLAERLSQEGMVPGGVEIHLDIGQHGETKELIREITGMVSGSGFDAKIKPDSYGASKVADKYTK